MNILLVDDYKEKLDEISDFLQKEYPYSTVKECYSFQSGLMEILLNNYDVIILDMSMPTYDIQGHEKGGPKKPFAGKEILRQMERKEVNTPVIVVTQFKSFGEGNKNVSIKQLREELVLFKNFIGMIHYTSNNTSWEQELTILLRKCDV